MESACVNVSWHGSENKSPRWQSKLFKASLGEKICSDFCPWKLSVPRSSQFSSSYALGKLFASRNR